jgi:uncharacterized protein YdbL (DUF1318 family)
MAPRSLARWAALLLALALALPAAAAALDLDAAKAKGLLGERVDGYVGVVVADPSPEVQALADSVNAQRRAAYEEIARRNGTVVDAVAARAGAKLIERAAPGEWVTDAAGNWYRK